MTSKHRGPQVRDPYKARKIYAALGKRQHDREYICRKTGFSRTTVYDVLKQLEAEGKARRAQIHLKTGGRLKIGWFKK